MKSLSLPFNNRIMYLAQVTIIMHGNTEKYMYVHIQKSTIGTFEKLYCNDEFMKVVIFIWNFDN